MLSKQPRTSSCRIEAEDKFSKLPNLAIFVVFGFTRKLGACSVLRSREYSTKLYRKAVLQSGTSSIALGTVLVMEFRTMYPLRTT